MFVSIELDMSRAGFMFNPTSCEPMADRRRPLHPVGQSAPSSDRFQVGGCQNLPFKPVLTASTLGRPAKSDGASLTVKVSQKPGEADIHKVELRSQGVAGAV